MSVGKVAAGTAGGLVGGAVGGAAFGALGAVGGAVETISLSASTTENKKIKVGDKQVEIPFSKSRVPGLIKTAIWGGVAAGATAIFALHPATWPLVGLLAAKYGLVGPAAGFVAGATARAVKNVAVGTAVAGLVGAGVGGAGGATIGANLAR
jgi:hypothetical protein